MLKGNAIRRRLFSVVGLFVVVLLHSPARAQVVDIVVGITPTCPYGLEACWGVAREGLTHLSGVTSIVDYPDLYNCTAGVRLEQGGLPDVNQWPTQFRRVVGEIQIFRGVELTVQGTVAQQGDALAVTVPGIRQPILLAPLEHKLQWNFKKKAERGFETAERRAFEQLVGEVKAAHRLHVEITGPFSESPRGATIAVREYFVRNRP